jgi:hypothetical protein
MTENQLREVICLQESLGLSDEQVLNFAREVSANSELAEVAGLSEWMAEKFILKLDDMTIRGNADN